MLRSLRRAESPALCARRARSPGLSARSRARPRLDSLSRPDLYSLGCASVWRLGMAAMGRSQVVRQRVLVPSFVGSNPAAPVAFRVPFEYAAEPKVPVRTSLFSCYPALTLPSSSVAGNRMRQNRRCQFVSTSQQALRYAALLQVCAHSCCAPSRLEPQWFYAYRDVI